MVKRVQKFDHNCKSFQNFDDGIKTETTRRTYHYILDELVRFANYTNYDELTKLDDDGIHELLKQWIRHFKQKELAYKTCKLKLNAAEHFFEMNKRIIYKKLLHKILPYSDGMPAGDVPFTTQELWLMKQTAIKPRDIAVIDFLASTGVRPGSLTDPVLKIKHTQEMSNGCMAIRVYDDTREGYWAFLTPEATQSLKRYHASRRRNGETLDDESVLFKNYENPNKKKDWIDANTIRQMLNGIIKHAGIERKKTKNRYDKPIIYGFRKRFNTILKLNNAVNSNIAEKLMAHKRGLDGVYLKPTMEQCFTEFQKAIIDLTLDPTMRQQIKIEKLEEEKNENKQLVERVKILEKELTPYREIEPDLKQLALEFFEDMLDKMEFEKTPRVKNKLLTA